MSEDAKSTKTTATTKTKPEKPAHAEEEAKPVVEEEGGFKEFIWNGEKKEFFGRTGKSWLDITIFYIIFFLSLYCFFMLSWYVSLMAVEPKIPYKHGDGSILYDKGPGLTFRPVPDRTSNGISTLIWFSTGVAGQHRYWTDQLKDWFEKIPQLGHPGVVECASGKSPKPSESCIVDKNLYGECGGSDPSFGYSIGEPCILLKLNRIYEWKPKPFSKEDLKKDKVEDKINGKDAVIVPEGLKTYLNSNFKEEHVYVWCEGEYDHDKENVGSIEYFPGPYIDKKYFPFMNQKNYQTPFIMLKLRRPMPGVLLSIVCKTFDKNSFPDRESGIGYARFQVLIGG